MIARRWIGRGLWLAAWAAWVWLGFGLYRELPRDLGSPICKLAIESEEHIVGFLHGENVIVTELVSTAPQQEIRRWNATTGERLKTLGGPSKWYGNPTSLRHHVTIGFNAYIQKEEPPEQHLQILNLMTGEWTPFGPLSWKVVGYHPEDPWVAVATNPENERAAALFVYDLRTRKRLFAWTSRPPENGQFDHIRTCHFHDSTKLLIVCDRVADGWKRIVDQRLIHCDMGGTDPTSSVVLGRPYARVSPPATNGLVVLTEPSLNAVPWEVVDSRSGRKVFAGSADPDLIAAANVGPAGWRRAARLSPSGKMLLTPENELWRVERGSLVSSPMSEAVWYLQKEAATDRFLTAEDWKIPIPAIQSLLNLTFAVRDMETSAVVYRTWNGHPALDHFSSDGKLAIDDDGSVYRIPPEANWNLLAICQAILATPLILLWVILRWRRRRRDRSAVAT